MHELTIVAPLGGLSSITLPMPASSSILIARTAPSLLPLSLNLLLARRALIWSIFPGSNRQKVATCLSRETEPVATCCEAVETEIYQHCSTYSIQIKLCTASLCKVVHCIHVCVQLCNSPLLMSSIASWRFPLPPKKAACCRHRSTKQSAALTAASDISCGIEEGVSMLNRTCMTAATLRSWPFDLLNIPMKWFHTT